jgi:hypothetical protein
LGDPGVPEVVALPQLTIVSTAALGSTYRVTVRRTSAG